GYAVWVAGSSSQAIGTNGLVTFSGLAAGDHEIALYGIATNCGVYTLNKGPNNPRGVFLIDAVVGAADFSLSCGSWGGLFVSTNTTGVDLDGDGYTVTVDGRTSQAIATNGSVTFTMLDVGSHSIALSGAAGNCTGSAANPGAVTVPAGGTGTTTLGVTCVVPGARVSGTGQLGMGSPTPQSNVQTFDFDVQADLTGRFSITAYDDVHSDGGVATVFADVSRDPTTFIKEYRSSSNACSVPSHGVEFDAMGRDGPDFVPFTVIAC